jgi:mitochondrial import receptor subunit TOM20
VDKSRSQSSASTVIDSAVLREALDRVRKEVVPDSQDEKEQYFMAQVAMGEQLATQGAPIDLPSQYSVDECVRL